MYKVKFHDKWFILKGLKEEYRNQSLYVKLLNKEFEIGFMMDHPNIAKIIDKKTDPIVGNCIMMEYVDGITLKEFLSSKHSRRQYDKIISELLNAMSYFHSKQIIHRDLKPVNILITHNGNNLKIIDFGFSDSEIYTSLKLPAGTVKYAAPEQIDQKVSVDCRADIYAFGLILKKIYPHRYHHVVSKCTRLDRERRYENVAEVQYAIKHTREIIRWSSIILLLLALTASFLIILNQIKDKSIRDQKVPKIKTTKTISVEKPIFQKVVSSTAPATSTSEKKQNDNQEQNRTDTENDSNFPVLDVSSRTPLRIDTILLNNKVDPAIKEYSNYYSTIFDNIIQFEFYLVDARCQNKTHEKLRFYRTQDYYYALCNDIYRKSMESLHKHTKEYNMATKKSLDSYCSAYIYRMISQNNQSINDAAVKLTKKAKEESRSKK